MAYRCTGKNWLDFSKCGTDRFVFDGGSRHDDTSIYYRADEMPPCLDVDFDPGWLTRTKGDGRVIDFGHQTTIGVYHLNVISDP